VGIVTKRLRVLYAIKALVQSALPGVEVLGLENEGAPPERIPPTGRIVIRAGDPGDPEIDLCPPTYNYLHQIPIEAAFLADPILQLTAEEVLDANIERLSDAIKADRTVGGEVAYLDGYSPETGDLYVPGAVIPRAADLVLSAAYSTPDPL
jgi:hypothetical protein